MGLEPAIFAISLLLATPNAMASGNRFLFCDPGANQFDSLALTNIFSTFLSHVNPDSSFQIVQDTQALSALLKDPSTHFAIVTSDYLASDAGRALRPVLVPSNHGDVFYRKILLDAGKNTLSSLSGKNIAVSSLAVDRDKSAVKAELETIGVPDPVIVPVPKDIDALLALSFGQVDAALVTPASIDVLKQVNPQAAAGYRSLGETQRKLRSPLCILKANVESSEVEAMVAALHKMSSLPEGRELMRQLSFDGWQRFDAGMLKK